MLEHWLQVCQVKITFTLLPTNCFVFATMNSIKCLVSWILLTICICSKNYPPHLKKENDDLSPQFRIRNYDYNSSHSKGRRTVIAGTSPSGVSFSFFEQKSVGLLWSWVNEDFTCPLDPSTQEILPSFRTLSNEAERMLDLPRQRSHQGKSPLSSTG